MKHFRSWWTVLPVSALILSGCNEKKTEELKADVKTVEKKAEAVVEKAVGETPAPVVKVLTPGERAAFLGIMGHLSKDTENAFTFLDGKEVVKRLRSLKTWGFIREVAQEESGSDPEDTIAEGAEEAGKYLGQEIFLALGKGSSTQIASLVKVNQKSTYLQFKMMTQAFAKQAATGHIEEGPGNDTGTAMLEGFKDLLKDQSLLDGVQFPPFLAGIKAADGETATESFGQMTMLMDQMSQGADSEMPGMLTPADFTKGGVQFKGYSVSGAAVAAEMEKNRADMDQAMDPADVTRIIETVKKKSLVVAAGQLDTYVMVYIGPSTDACPLVDKPEDSLVANDDFSFVDGYAGKKVVTAVYGSQAMSKNSVNPTLKPMADGVRDGLAKAPGFGDTRDLATLLDTIGEKEGALLSMAKVNATGGLVVLEDGVKFELFGGVDYGALDYDSPHKLGNLPSNDDTLMTASWIADPKYRKTAGDLSESMIETVYAIAGKAASLGIQDSSEFDQFKQGFGIFDQKFRTDVIGLWSGMQTYDAGVGDESAFVVDLKGAMPPIPKVPQELVDKGKFIRISAIAPVVDRSKLSDGWTKMNGSLRNIIKTVSEMAQTDVPMPQPSSSENNGLTTWSFQFPIFTDDFTPSVTVSDKWFVASTSKKQAIDLIGIAEGPKSERKGAWMELNFAALNKFGAEWLELLETTKTPLDDFRSELPKIRKGLEAAKEWDKLEVYSRKEGGKIHTSVHLKVK